MKRVAEMSDIKPILRKLPRIKKYLLNSDNIRWVPARKKRGVLVREAVDPECAFLSALHGVLGFSETGGLWKSCTSVTSLGSLCLQRDSYGLFC